MTLSQVEIEKINQKIGGDEVSLEILKSQGVLKSYHKGYRIYPDSELGLLYFINGKSRFFSISENSKEITIFHISQGESCIISTNCVFHHIQPDMALEFCQDSEVFIVPNKTFESLIQSNENIMKFSLWLISLRLKQAFDTISDITFESLKNRVVKFLLNNAHNGSITASQERIANHIGSAREAVCRVIKELRDERLISTHRNHIVLRDEIYHYWEKQKIP